MLLVAELVAARSVSIAIGGLEVVSDLELSVQPGAAVGLVGESGSGKSVACRALTGTLGLIGGKVTAGELVMCGQDMSNATEKEWRRLRGRKIALVPQASLSGLDPLMRVRSQVRESVRAHDRGANAADRARELLLKVGLDSALLARYPHELSGGQRQRVMIALALAGGPDVLIADEPTTALDVTVQRSILGELRELCVEDGMGLVLVSHDFGVIEQVCDDVVVMYGGCSMEVGNLNQVTSQARHPYTRELLAARPRLDGAGLHGIEGMPPSPRAWPPGCRFAPRCRFCEAACTAARPQLLAADDGVRVACIRHEEISAEAMSS
jgi:oligopeptide/dipeptide ABC transporter ATP-binding protein